MEIGSSTLKASLRRAEAKKRRGAFLLTTPLLLFIAVMFLLPLASMFWLSVSNLTIPSYMPKTVAALSNWDAKALPPEAAYAAVAADLKEAFKHHTFGRIGKRLNEESPGSFGLINKSTFRTAHLAPPTSWKATLEKIDPSWGKMPIWRLLKRESSYFTADFYLAAIDLQYGDDGSIQRVPAYARVYIPLFIRTIWMSLLVTVLTLVLGYPLAYWISRMPESKANLMMIAVLLPFWTSLLVRITAWIVLLQSHGVINSALVNSGLVADAHRPQLINNGLGTVIVMTQVLAAVHGAAALQRDARYSGLLRAGGRFTGLASVARLLARVRTAHIARHRRWRLARLHSVDRLLHHARTGGRPDRPVYQ